MTIMFVWFSWRSFFIVGKEAVNCAMTIPWIAVWFTRKAIKKQIRLKNVIFNNKCIDDDISQIWDIKANVFFLKSSAYTAVHWYKLLKCEAFRIRYNFHCHGYNLSTAQYPNVTRTHAFLYLTSLFCLILVHGYLYGTKSSTNCHNSINMCNHVNLQFIG